MDRSISGPQDFISTDVLGTHTLLEAVRRLEIPRYLQISTDEVYGSIEDGRLHRGVRPGSLQPVLRQQGGRATCWCSPTTAPSARPSLITRSSNNYGAWQYPEKIVPLFITNAIDDLQLPVYGDGLNVRDWLYVDDNCAGIDLVLREGVPGQVYNIGGGNEVQNLTITHRILELLGKDDELIRFVTDRPGHDRRYAIDCSKLRSLGWRPEVPFEAGLARTVDWYARPTRSGGGRSSRASGAPTTPGSTASSPERRRRASAHGTFHTGVPTCTRENSHVMLVLARRVQPCE